MIQAPHLSSPTSGSDSTRILDLNRPRVTPRARFSKLASWLDLNSRGDADQEARSPSAFGREKCERLRTNAATKSQRMKMPAKRQHDEKPPTTLLQDGAKATKNEAAQP